MEVQLKLNDQLLFITGEYEPEEPEVRYYPDGSGYPGTPSEFYINKVEWETVNGTIDITNLINSLTTEDRIYEELENLACKEIEK
jgi:hypothetical protein|tara:strand:- start:1090 stop:1344 length:255 start_codon:yes stop_codon:yes gene_type:complete